MSTTPKPELTALHDAFQRIVNPLTEDEANILRRLVVKVLGPTPPFELDLIVRYLPKEMPEDPEAFAACVRAADDVACAAMAKADKRSDP